VKNLKKSKLIWIDNGEYRTRHLYKQRANGLSICRDAFNSIDRDWWVPLFDEDGEMVRFSDRECRQCLFILLSEDGLVHNQQQRWLRYYKEQGSRERKKHHWLTPEEAEVWFANVPERDLSADEYSLPPILHENPDVLRALRIAWTSFSEMSWYSTHDERLTPASYFSRFHKQRLERRGVKKYQWGNVDRWPDKILESITAGSL